MSIADDYAAWLAWACPAAPSSMLDEPALARLRERWPVAGGGEGPADMRVLLRTWAPPKEPPR